MSRVEEMRQSFDRAFAEPERGSSVAPEALLSVDIDGSAYAIRVAEIAGVLAGKTVTPMPSSIPALRGLCASRGTLLPVYDLAQILGHPRSASSRWLCQIARPVLALALDGFPGHLRVDRSRVVPAVRGAFVREAVDEGGRARSIIHLQSVIDAIAAQVRPHKER